MKSCKLFVRNDGLPNQFYEMKVVEGTPGQVGRVVDEMKTVDPGEVYTFLGKYGVSGPEIVGATNVMEDLGHNVASFGMLGHFVISHYEGPIQ